MWTWWTDGLKKEPEYLEVSWEYSEKSKNWKGVFQPLGCGWKAPLWQVQDKGLALIRPEGLWIIPWEKIPQEVIGTTVTLKEKGASGWSSRRGLSVDFSKKDGVWRNAQGEKEYLAEKDAEKKVEGPWRDEVQAYGEWMKIELTEEGFAVLWLDDAFASGPFSVLRKKDHMIVSNGDYKVLYEVIGMEWIWALLDRRRVYFKVGRSGGWEKESMVKPIEISDQSWDFHGVKSQS